MQTDRFAKESARMGEFRRRIVRQVQCHSCGFEPVRESPPAYCPKCGGGCWESFVRLGKLRPDRPVVRATMRPAMEMTTVAIESGQV